MENDNTELSLDELFKLALENVSYDDTGEDDIYAKFDFAFPLLKIANECHSGMGSDLYRYSSALISEWKFSAGIMWDGELEDDNMYQLVFFEWLKDHFNVRKLYE